MIETRALARARLAARGSLHGVHWVVLATSLVLTVFAYRFAREQHQERVEAGFGREVERVAELIVERMAHYEDALRAGVAYLHAEGGAVTRPEWRGFAEGLRVEERYPGVNGIGFIYNVERSEAQALLDELREHAPGLSFHPEHERDELWPIVYIEPQAPNAAAVGLDMAHEENRYRAAVAARDLGEPQITGPIVLVQDAEQTPGFLFFSPVFSDEGTFLGHVYAPFVTHSLVTGTLAQASRLVSLRIADGDEVVYEEPDAALIDPDPLYRRTVVVPMYGRTWSLHLESALPFREQSRTNQPLTILVSGLVLDGLLLLLFVLLSRSNRTALAYADAMTEQLEARNRELGRSNEDLEQFARVASHDLRTPVRTVIHLGVWLQEDLAPALADDDPVVLPADVRREARESLAGLVDRSRRMGRLLEDLLQFSLAARGRVDPVPVDVSALLEDAARLQEGGGVRIEVRCDVGEVLLPGAALATVVRNLVGNAVQHHDRSEGLVEVVARREGDHLHIEVRDDGPGIPPEHQARVFDLYQTLGSSSTSTGLGLALVKRLAERHGARIGLHSEGRGTTVSVDWPVGDR